MKREGIIVAGLCMVLLCASCSTKIDTNRFQGANRSARALERSVRADAPYQELGELLKRLNDEVTVLEDTVKSKKEKELADQYFVLLTMYRDGFLLWRYQTEFSGHSFVPPGRIYVGQDLEPIVTKYRFETESHIFGPTHQSWKSISADSIRIVWDNAAQQLRRIDTLQKEEG